jgi:hypothetical protein
MSGLGAAAALALACNVLQIIGFARETIRIAKQVYQNGDLDLTLQDHAKHLDDTVQRVRSMTAAPRAKTATTTAATAATATQTATPATANHRDKQLLELANRCMGTTVKLRKEVDSLIGRRPHSICWEL